MGKKKPGDYQIPFRNGNLCHYPMWPTEPTEWLKNFTFAGTLVYQGYRRGRSAAYIEFKCNENGAAFPMFLTHFDSVVSLMVNGSVRAEWTFTKCGQNYGICLAPKEATP
jgi:hypothetical protein